MQDNMNIIECIPINDKIPSIADSGNRGYCYLCSVENKWIFPFYRFIKFNINKIYLPEHSIGIISTLPHHNSITAKTCIIPECNFPNGIYVKNNNMFPYYVHAGDRIAVMYVIPLQNFHVMEPTST